VNKKYVLDTSAIMAFLEEELGADTIEELLEQAQIKQITVYVSFVTFTEIFYISIQEQGERIASERLKRIESMPIFRMESNPELTKLAGKMKAKYRISLADTFIAALAKKEDAVLVHKDPEFESLKGQIEMLILPYK
jgi:predicted nucleic acid-binding protein